MTIDRRSLVRRHNPVFTALHPVDTRTVGNGDVAMTVDISGLQTFPASHELRPDPFRVPSDGASGLPEQRRRPFDRDDFQIPLRTQATWGWYKTRTSRPLALDDARSQVPTARGPVPYLDRMGIQRAADPIPDDLAAGAWFSYNPRRAHLGRLALTSTGDGPDLRGPDQLTSIRAELDLWTGTAHSAYLLEGTPVQVTTVADPVEHRFAVRVTSDLLRRGLSVSWIFDEQPDDLADFELPLRQSVDWNEVTAGHWRATRHVESSSYTVDIETTGALTIGDQAALMVPHGDDVHLDVVVTLNPTGPQRTTAPATFATVRDRSEAWWERYWTDGAAVTFDGSTDERAPELERRVVLSQYLTVVNGAGTAPPAETGLTYNTWTGKFHLEMHWWHAAHFPLWGRGHLLERSLPWYHGALDSARATATAQGYRGARWPKQTDLSARESPSHIGVFLIWQQPHLIYLLELLFNEGRSDAFLAEHYPLVEATADFMADFVDERGGTFTLPPPLIPAQESYLVDRATNADPTFELAYWSWGLKVANEWRARLGLTPREDWRRVGEGMRRPTVLDDGTYAALATPPYVLRKDHPSMLMAAGWLPDTDLIDIEVMSATLDEVWRSWDLQSSWGWDYPVMAMTAARLGDPGRALDALLLSSPKNEFLANGHNPQMPGFLSIYLPANGGLLAAIAHLVEAASRSALPAAWTLTAEGFGTLPQMRATADPGADLTVTR